MRPIKTYISKTHHQNGIIVSVAFLSFLFLCFHFYWQNYDGFSDSLIASGDLVFSQGQWYRAFTSIFIHADLNHLLSNSYMLFFLIYLNYSYFGPLLFPTLAIIFSTLINIIALYTYHPQIQLLGASGLAYLLGGCWLSLFILIDRRISFGLRVFKAIAIALIIFFPQSLVTEVSYRTHFFGFLLGILTGAVYFILKMKKIRRAELYPEPELDPESPEDF